MPKPDHKTVTKRFWHMKAKDVVKNDRLSGLGGARVTNNEKNSFGERVITLQSYSRKKKTSMTLIVPKNATLNVSRSKCSNPKKK